MGIIAVVCFIIVDRLSRGGGGGLRIEEGRGARKNLKGVSFGKAPPRTRAGHPICRKVSPILEFN